MIASALRIAAWGGVGALLVVDSAGNLALWGIVVTSVAGLVAQILKARAEAQREERQHQFLQEDREQAEATRRALLHGLEENAGLTRGVSDKADLAFETANHVNEKIASLASAALALDRATAQRDTDLIRGDIARGNDPPEPGEPKR
jgi:hypothetical protein